jgi:hypothetical protein
MGHELMIVTTLFEGRGRLNETKLNEKNRETAFQFNKVKSLFFTFTISCG